MRRQIHPSSPSIPWHTAYLTVTVIAFGLVVGAFSVTSLLYWYDVSDHRIRERRP